MSLPSNRSSRQDRCLVRREVQCSGDTLAAPRSHPLDEGAGAAGSGITCAFLVKLFAQNGLCPDNRTAQPISCAHIVTWRGLTWHCCFSFDFASKSLTKSMPGSSSAQYQCCARPQSIPSPRQFAQCVRNRVCVSTCAGISHNRIPFLAACDTSATNHTPPCASCAHPHCWCCSCWDSRTLCMETTLPLPPARLRRLQCLSATLLARAAKVSRTAASSQASRALTGACDRVDARVYCEETRLTALYWLQLV